VAAALSPANMNVASCGIVFSGPSSELRERPQILHGAYLAAGANGT
jgi:hypothetical protein